MDQGIAQEIDMANKRNAPTGAKPTGPQEQSGPVGNKPPKKANSEQPQEEEEEEEEE